MQMFKTKYKHLINNICQVILSLLQDTEDKFEGFPNSKVRALRPPAYCNNSSETENLS